MGHENVPLPGPTLHAKLVRPRLQSVYSRTCLFEVLAQHDGSRAFWICGPAGSGKTTLVNSYLHSCDTCCIWYELDESDADVASFFYHLGLAASDHVNDGPMDFPLLTPEFFPNIPVFTRRFFETLCAHVPSPCAIVLDNYQKLRGETLLHEVLCTAIDTLGQGFSIYVCSRREPPAELARPRANCAIQMLGSKHLQLDTDEACGVAAQVLGADYPKSVIKTLHAKTDGWMAGLLLPLRRGEFEDVEPHLLANHTPWKYSITLEVSCSTGSIPKSRTSFCAWGICNGYPSRPRIGSEVSAPWTCSSVCIDATLSHTGRTPKIRSFFPSAVSGICSETMQQEDGPGRTSGGPVLKRRCAGQGRAVRRGDPAPWPASRYVGRILSVIY